MNSSVVEDLVACQRLVGFNAMKTAVYVRHWPTKFDSTINCLSAINVEEQVHHDIWSKAQRHWVSRANLEQ